ncbi:MAG: hypothetical protein ACLQBQ_07920 [Smithella sp.]
MKYLQKNSDCGNSRLVDFINRLLHPADSMVCLFTDYTPATGRNSLPLG